MQMKTAVYDAFVSEMQKNDLLKGIWNRLTGNEKSRLASFFINAVGGTHSHYLRKIALIENDNRALRNLIANTKGLEVQLEDGIGIGRSRPSAKAQ